MPFLGSPVISGIHPKDHGLVTKIGPGVGRLKAGYDALEIVGELWTQQPPHILEEERCRRNFPDGSNGLRPHIPIVMVTAMLPGNAEWLTRRPSGNELHAGKTSPINLPHVAPFDRPGRHVLDTSLSIKLHGRDGTTVPLDHQIVLETGSSETEGETPAAGEELDAVHGHPPCRSPCDSVHGTQKSGKKTTGLIHGMFDQRGEASEFFCGCFFSL
jgi:hypothetical protein